MCAEGSGNPLYLPFVPPDPSLRSGQAKEGKGKKSASPDRLQ